MKTNTCLLRYRPDTCARGYAVLLIPAREREVLEQFFTFVIRTVSFVYTAGRKLLPILPFGFTIFLFF